MYSFPPNPRLQRTRSAPLRSPLSRKPLGLPKNISLVGAVLLVHLVTDGCSSTSINYSPVGPHQYNAALSLYHAHGLFHLGSCGFSQDGESYHIALLGQHQMYTSNELELKIDDKVIQRVEGSVQILEKHRARVDLYVQRPNGKRVPLPVNGVWKYD